jgi:hypothetical protein
MESSSTWRQWFHHHKCRESAQDPRPSLPFECDGEESHNGWQSTTGVGSADGHATIQQCSVDAGDWS